MASSTKEIFLDDLTSQLEGITKVVKATRRLLPPDQQETFAPYIGVQSGLENLLLSNASDETYRLEVILSLLTNEDNYSIENLIEDVKDLIKTIDLGSSVFRVTYLESAPVDIEDRESDRYSKAEILLEIYYNQNYAISTPIEEWSLTEPTGYALYKVYETVFSGSTSIQASGTNVYSRHDEAALFIPASSGSVTVDVDDCTINDESAAIYSDELVNEYLTAISIRIHTGYLTEDNAKSISIPMMDNIRNLLWGTSTLVDLGDNYRVVYWGAPTFNGEFESTVGANCTVVVSKVLSGE